MSISPPKFSANLTGIIFMVFSAVLMTGMAVMVRQVAEGMHPFQVAFLRNLLGVMFLAPLLLKYGLETLQTNDMGWMAARGVFNAAAMLSFFMALTMLPLANISALMFTVPLFVSLMAVIFLKELMGPRRTLSLIVGFSGALIILRPGFEVIGVGSLFALFSAFSWGTAVVIIKRLSRTNSTLTVTIYGMSFLTLFTLPPALFVWQWPNLEQVLWLIAIAGGGTIGQLFFTQSLKVADATLVMPFDFTKLIWASLFGFVFFSEIPVIWVFVGGAVIFASTSYLTYREGRDKMPAKPMEVV